MDANLEIARMRKEIVEVINKHQMPVTIAVFLLKDILAEAQAQLDIALNNAIVKEKEKESMLNAECSEGNPKPSETTA